METSHPPVYYVPPEDVRMDLLKPGSGSSFCEWKGRASYLDAHVAERHVEQVAWTYDRPTPPFGDLAGYIAFYPGRVDACYLDGEPVQPQPGRFYGGWITKEIVGPFKGGPGTLGW